MKSRYEVMIARATCKCNWRNILYEIFFSFAYMRVSWQSIHRAWSFIQTRRATSRRRDPKSHAIARWGRNILLINLLAIPIDRKSPGYKEKRAFPPGGTETLDSFLRAWKASLAYRLRLSTRVSGCFIRPVGQRIVAVACA